MARSVEQLSAWAELLELCEDDCAVFSTSEAQRSAVIEVERELQRLHKIEEEAIDLARMVLLANRGIDDSGASGPGFGEEWLMDVLWGVGCPGVCQRIVSLVPEAFEAKELEAAILKWRQLP